MTWSDQRPVCPHQMLGTGGVRRKPRGQEKVAVPR